MAVAKGMLAGMAGAAAYNAYKDSDGVFSSKDIAGGLYDAFQRRGAASINEVTRMQKNIDDLQSALLKSLHDKQQPTVIVAGGSRQSGWSTATGVVVIIGGVAVYLRFVKGWRFGDLMYVTKASLQNMKESMTEGLTRVNEQLRAASEDLLEKLRGVTAKQDDMLQQQAAMDDTLRLVGDDVQGVHYNVQLLQDQVGYSNQAITLLCGALSEVAKRCGISNGRYVRALDSLTHSVHIEGLDGPVVRGHIEGAGPEASVAPRPNPAVFTLPATPIVPSSSSTSSAANQAGPSPRPQQASYQRLRSTAGGGGPAGGPEPLLAGTSEFAAQLHQQTAPRRTVGGEPAAPQAAGGSSLWWGSSGDKKKG